MIFTIHTILFSSLHIIRRIIALFYYDSISIKLTKNHLTSRIKPLTKIQTLIQIKTVIRIIKLIKKFNNNLITDPININYDQKLRKTNMKHL